MFSWMLVLGACGRAEPPAPGQPDRPHIILITLDTTRADALSTYGAAPGTTPNLDALAATGTRFTWALSHVPSTLSSHVSMFTGLDPHGHGVPRNGFPLDAGFDTLAERLAGVGYDTQAVVAASVLDRSMGLDAGFVHYDDTVPIDQVVRYEDRADSVTDRALVAAERRAPGTPLFLWVHYFDAHHPYKAPPEVASRFVDPVHVPPWVAEAELGAGESFRRDLAGPEDMVWLRTTYQAEVAWMDLQIGRLLRGLEARDLLDDAVVLVVGDHGEMFGEEPERPMGHSFDIDLAITRVPLIVHRRGPQAWTPGVVDQPVKVSDVGPTLLAFAGVEDRLGHGQDLGPLLIGAPLDALPIFLEATRGRRIVDNNSWNNLENERGVLKDGEIFIRGPFGPDRVHALDAQQTELHLDATQMRLLEQVLEAWDRGAPPYRAPIPDSPLQAALEALGYLDFEVP